jgi:hypothetical protein
MRLVIIYLGTRKPIVQLVKDSQRRHDISGSDELAQNFHPAYSTRAASK